MKSNQEHNQLGQGSKIDKRRTENDDDFLSGDNKAIYHPNLDQYEFTTEDEDRYNNGNSEHDDFIINGVSEEEGMKTRYSSPSRNGSHRNH